MAITLTQGTKEYINVDVVDALGGIATLDGTTPKFDIIGPSPSSTSKYTQQAALNTVMKLKCLVDTSAGHPNGLWTTGTYKLYVNFTTAPELPRLGPFEIEVVA